MGLQSERYKHRTWIKQKSRLVKFYFLSFFVLSMSWVFPGLPFATLTLSLSLPYYNIKSLTCGRKQEHQSFYCIIKNKFRLFCRHSSGDYLFHTCTCLFPCQTTKTTQQITNHQKGKLLGWNEASHHVCMEQMYLIKYFSFNMILKVFSILHLKACKVMANLEYTSEIV